MPEVNKFRNYRIKGGRNLSKLIDNLLNINVLPASMAKMSLEKEYLARLKKIRERVRVCIRDDEDMSANLTSWFDSLIDVYCLEINMNNSKCFAIVKEVLMCLADKADINAILLLVKTHMDSGTN